MLSRTPPHRGRLSHSRSRRPATRAPVDLGSRNRSPRGALRRLREFGRPPPPDGELRVTSPTPLALLPPGRFGPRRVSRARRATCESHSRLARDRRGKVSTTPSWRWLLPG